MFQSLCDRLRRIIFSLGADVMPVGFFRAFAKAHEELFIQLRGFFEVR